MYKIGLYTASDKMSELICDNYSMLLVLSRFGIPLGFGENSIGKVCESNNVDTDTFLAIVNLIAEDIIPAEEEMKNISQNALLDYLKNSHVYFLDFRLPSIRNKLIEAIECVDESVSIVIMRFYDEYVGEVHKHMNYEDETVFPYIESLLDNRATGIYSIDRFSKKHDKIETRLSELKDIIIKYYPTKSSNELNCVLFDIFSCSNELASHNLIEDNLLVPLVRALECKSVK